MAEVRARVERAAIGAGRAPGAVTLVVVSKTVPAAVVRDALAAGAVDLGENRAQELVAKAAELSDVAPAPRWHFIGRLQRNKVRMLAGVVELWHSIDRPELAEPLARHCPGARVLVEVNLSEEPQKGGCPPGDAPALVERLTGSGLVVEGLMTVPAATGDPRPVFAALREMGSRLGLAELSMGMTADFEAAIAEGATIVRVGSAVFGPRSGPEGLRR
ncbi:MAG TPA: YggS family pyridoxal phosphate-dependent enzyme [Acidimicrobiia bacterium]